MSNTLLNHRLVDTAVTLLPFHTYCLCANDQYAYRMTRTCGQPQSHWEQLSPELWRVIFAQLPARPGLFVLQQTFSKLPLVCSKFRNILSGQPDMCSRLFLNKAVAGSHVPHLLGFARRHAGAMSDLDVSFGYPCVELVLAILLTHQAPISRVTGLIPGKALHLLAALKTLTHCHLEGQYEASMCLQPLKSLPDLISLDLAVGQYTMLDAAAQHLTRLKLVDCEAICVEDCLCVTSLRQLYCSHSNLAWFHQEGLPACSQLESLVCESSNIHTVNAAESVLFGGPDHCVSASMSALTALSSLSFTCDTEVGSVDLDWLTQLTALKKLEAKLAAECIVLPGCLSSLSSLKQLCVVALRDEHLQLTLELVFRHLVALEEIRIHGNFNAETYGILSLAELQRLRVVDFSCFTAPGRYMTGQLALLAHKLGKHRPDNQFTAGNDWAFA